MKSLAAPVLATASFSIFALSGLGAAASLQQPYRLHEFQNMNSGIWTSGPVRIDPARQKLERVTALSPAVTRPENDQPADTGSAAIVMATAQAETQLAEAKPGTVANTTGAVLCQQKYRSYRTSDNSYQPLGGGARRQCELSSGEQGAEAGGPQTASSPTSSSFQADWCRARFSSYNPADNTYQPFGGGQRRVCAPPVTLASNG